MKFVELWVDGDSLNIPPSTIDRVWTGSDRPCNVRHPRDMRLLYPSSLQRLTPALGTGDVTLSYAVGEITYDWIGPSRERSEFWSMTRPLTAEEARRWNVDERRVVALAQQQTGFVQTAEPGDWLFIPGERPVPAAPGITAKADMRIYRGFPPAELLDLFFFAQGLK